MLSPSDLSKLETCDPRLQSIVLELAKTMLLEVIQGHRTLEQHKVNLASGASKAKVSKHCAVPSQAVDLAPQGAKAMWSKKKDLPPEAYVKVANAFLSEAKRQGVKVRWGGDWDMKNDGNPKGTLNDLVHFELMEA